MYNKKQAVDIVLPEHITPWIEELLSLLYFISTPAVVSVTAAVFHLAIGRDESSKQFEDRQTVADSHPTYPHVTLLSVVSTVC